MLLRAVKEAHLYFDELIIKKGNPSARHAISSSLTVQKVHALSFPPPHPRQTPQRLPQKSLPRRQAPLSIHKPLNPHPFLPKDPLPSPHDRRHNQRQLHLRHIPPHTSPRPCAKRNKSLFLLFCYSVGRPAGRIKGVGVRTPDFRGVVDGVGGDGEDGSWGEGARSYGYGGAGRDEAGEAEGGGGVDAEGFGDHLLET